MSALNDVRVYGFIGPPDSTDTFATHYAAYGRGGWQAAANAAARDAITADRREQDMAVILQSDGSIWLLNAPPWNFDDTDWTQLPVGGTVTSLSSGTGISLSPSTITSTGTISVADSTPDTIAGYDDTGVFSSVTLGTGLSLSGGILSSTISGFIFVAPGCRVATTANLTVTYNNGTAGVGATLTNSGSQAALTLDGISLNANDYVLVKDQTSQLQNGIYTVTTVGSVSTNWVLTRAANFDETSEIVQGSYTVVAVGTANAGTLWIQTGATPITVGTDAIQWTKFGTSATGTVSSISTAPGSGLTLTPNPIVTTGTIAMTAGSHNTLAGYDNTGAFSGVSIGTGLSLASGTLSVTNSGTVTSLAAGTGISLSPSTITSTGSISVSSSTANTLAGYDNSGVFSDVTIGTGLSLSSGTIIFVGTTAVYDNSTSGLIATNVQAAIDELATVVGAVSGSFLVSGGQVVWVSGYTFMVSAATYYIQGVLHSSTQQSVTLPTADPSLDRIDVIFVDNTGAVGSITGTPALLPIQPQVDPATQLLLTPIFVAAGSSGPPNITMTLIYNDNVGPPTEWTASTNSVGTINVNSTNNPYTGTKDVEATAAVAGNYVQFQAPSSLDASTQTFLVFYVRVKAAWPKSKNLNITFRSSGTAVGVAVTLSNGAFGFSSALTGVYQQVAIPMTDFGLIAGGSENQVRIAVAGGGAAIGFYLDYVQLQMNGNQPPGILPVPGGGTGVGTFAPYAIITGGVTATGPLQQVSGLGVTGQALISNGAGALPSWQTLPTGTGTVTNVSVVSANGLAGTVANPTTTPAITLRTTITGLLQGNGTALSAVTIGAGLTFSGGTLAATATGGGTITTVGLSMPAEFSVAGSPLTGSGGTLAVTKATQLPNLVYAGPSSGSASAPTFRALVSADIPAGIVLLSNIQQIPATTIVANPTGVPASPTTVTLGAGLAFSGTTLLVPVDGISTSQIINSAVTYAKMQSMSAHTLLGNPTGSAANPSEVTLDATNLVFNGSALSCLGGLRTVATHAARNALISGEPATCAEGMIVYTQNTAGTDAIAGYWELLPQPWSGTDSDWKPAGPLQVDLSGTPVGARGILNFIPGTSVTLNVTDNSANDRIDVTINSVASGTGTVTTLTAGVGIALSPNPITTSGTISVADSAPNSVAGWDNSGIFGLVTVGTGLSLASGVLSTTISGFTFIPPGCRVGTTANLAAAYNNGSAGVGATLTNSGTQAALTVDGISLNTSDYVLVKNQTSQFQNGIYTVTNVGSVSTNWVLTRATNFDQSSEILQGSYTVVAIGTANAGTIWIQTAPTPIAVGTDAIQWTEINIAGSGTVTSISAGTGITCTPNPISTTGTISVSPSAANTLAGYNNSGVFSDVAIGSGLTLASGILATTGGGGVPTGTAGQVLIWDSTAAAFSSIVEVYSATSPNAIGVNAIVLNGDGGTASGTSSLASGTNSQATGGDSFAGGSNTLASGLNSFSIGEHTTASGRSSFASGSGFGLAASGDFSFTHGYLCDAGAYASYAGGGNCSTASGCDYAHVEGSGTTASNNAVAGHAEGEATTVSAEAAHAGGRGASAAIYAQWARSDGGLNAYSGGFGQYGVISAAIQTTDATPTNLAVGPHSLGNRIVIPTNHVLAFVATIVGRKSDGSSVIMMIRQGVVQNLSGTTAIVGEVGTIGADIDVVGWTAAISADNANSALQIQVTGAAATTINWMAKVDFVEVK
jgi:hypothetical protein